MSSLSTITEALAKIEARENAATEGPWYHRQAGEAIGRLDLDWIADAPRGQSHHKIILEKHSLYGGTSDYAFIAHSRSDVPRLRKALEMAVKAMEDAMPFEAPYPNEDVAANILQDALTAIAEELKS